MKKLTIVLLLKERQEFNKRFINFFLSCGFDYNLIISDGSKKKIDDKLLKKIKENKAIKYIKFRPDTSYKIFFQKIIKSLKIVKTEFVLFAANDDFFIYKTVDKALQFLLKNKTFIGAGGTWYDFKISKKHKKSKLANIKLLYKNINLTHKNNLIRSKKFFENFNDLPRNLLLKKKIFLDAYKLAYKYFDNNIELKDHFVALYIVASGRIKVFNQPILLHQSHYNSEGVNRTYLAKSLINDKTYIDKLILFDKLFAKKLKINKNIILKYYYNNIFLNIINQISNMKELSIKDINKLILKKIKRKIKTKNTNYSENNEKNLQTNIKQVENFLNNNHE